MSDSEPSSHSAARLPALPEPSDGWPDPVVALFRPVAQEGHGLHPADRPDLHPDPDDLVVAVGVGLARLHDRSGPVAAARALSADTGWPALAERCRQVVAAGAVEQAALPSPYDRYRPQDLLAMVEDNRPATEQLVLCHGHPTLARFLIGPDGLVGFDEAAPVVADRHFDLAMIHQSIHRQLGPEAVFRFYQAYGADPDLVRLDHYILVCHLLGLSPRDSQQAPS